ncbi:MAG: hypothetical protein ABSG63_03410 [Spirochaetia bacterium]|jgi:DNA-binding MarR family transcriptional regulator
MRSIIEQTNAKISRDLQDDTVGRWVKRTRSATDARVKRLFLTARGRRLIEEARRATGPVEDRIAAALTEEERTTLKKLLRIMVEGTR